MESYREVITGALKTVPAWLGVFLGHAIDSITLSGIALLASTVYSVVQTYVTLKRERRARSSE